MVRYAAVNQACGPFIRHAACRLIIHIFAFACAAVS
jgi:hypothetical protein